MCCFHGDQIKDVEAVKLNEVPEQKEGIKLTQISGLDLKLKLRKRPLFLSVSSSSHADGVLVQLHDHGSRLSQDCCTTR